MRLTHLGRLFGLLLAVFAETSVATFAASASWQSRDIGSVAAAGSATETGAGVIVRGSGADIWERNDEFHFRYTSWSGDGEMIVRVSDFQQSHGWAKAGIMFRDDPYPDSRHVFVCVTGQAGTALQRRPVTGRDSESTSGAWATAPRWLRLVRSGNTFFGYESDDGQAWSHVGTTTVDLAPTALVGLAVTSHSDGVISTATFTDITLRPLAVTGPAAPSGLAVTAISHSQVDLVWTDNSSNEGGFEVQAVNSGGSVERTITVGANVTSASITGLWPEVEYRFQVRGVSDQGNSAFSNVATATTRPTPAPTTLAAPSGLSAVVLSRSSIRLSWIDNSSTEHGFEIGFSTDGAVFDWCNRRPANATTAEYAGLPQGTTYYFRVRAYQDTVHSDASNLVAATTLNEGPQPPAAPTNLRAVAMSPVQVNLSWQSAPVENGWFRIERAQQDSHFVFVMSVQGYVTSYNDTALSPGTAYQYRVSAANNLGESSYATTSVTTPSTVPGNWIRSDIGAVAAAGSHEERDGTLIVRGSGDDIWDPSDEFTFLHQPLTGDTTFIADVILLEAPEGWAKAGLMLRESLAPGSRYAMVLITRQQGAGFQSRAGTNDASVFIPASVEFHPARLRLVRSGNTFTASQSRDDGSTWMTIGSVTLDLPATVYAGLAVTSHRDGTLCTAAFNNVRLSGTSVPPIPTLPAPSGLIATARSTPDILLRWTDNAAVETAYEVERSTDNVTYVPLALLGASAIEHIDSAVAVGQHYFYRVRARRNGEGSAYSNIAQATATGTPAGSPWQHVDIGNVGIAGSDDAAGTTITIRASGADIWDRQDGFRFVYRVLRGDCTVEARITGIGGVQNWAKAGVMIRASLAPDARNVFACMTLGVGAGFQVRADTGGTTTFTPGPWGLALPQWVRLVRSGGTVAASHSADGVTWSPLGTAALPYSGDVYVGFAVTGHDNNRLTPATFQDPYIR